MHPKTIFTGILIFMAVLANAQDSIRPIEQDTALVPVVVQPRFIVRLSFLKPGLQGEITIGIYKTLLLEASAGIGYQYYSSNGYTSSKFSVIPAFTAQYRYYTNLEQRKYKNKVTDNYSGTYIGIPATVFLNDGYAGFTFGIMGGFQRQLGKKGFWNISFGAGNQWMDGSSDFGFISDMCIGLMLN